MPDSFDRGSTVKAGYFNCWTPFNQHGAVRERLLQKLGQALSNSIAIAAAFTNADVYELNTQQPPASGTAPDAQSNTEPSNKTGGTSGAAKASEAPDWNWVRHTGKQQRRRSLIGFVRANGDVSLTATIYDLAVHPEFRSFGIGTKLLRLLTQQLYQKEVYDIGSVVPQEAQRFFSRCCFEEDREQSTTLTFLQHHDWRAQGAVPGLMQADMWLLEPQQQQRQPHSNGPTPEQQEAGQVGAQPPEVRVPVDPLALIPTPATEELRCNEGLLAIMRDKMEQAVPLSPAQTAQHVTPAAAAPAPSTPTASLPAVNPQTPATQLAPELDYHL